MRNAFSSKLKSLCLSILIVSGSSVFIPLGVAAQQLTMQEFVLFAGKANCTNCGVQIGSSTTIVNGKVGSYQSVKTTGSTQINGNIHSANRIELANSNTVNGNVYAGTNLTTSSVLFSTGSNASLNNVYVNGSISIGGGKISGQVVHPQNTTYNGPNPSGGRIRAVPNLPILPATPAISVFQPAGNQLINTSRTIAPGASSGAIELNGGQTLNFSGTGTYVFSRIKISGNSNKFVLDFNNNLTGIINIQVHGDVDLDKLNVELVNGGSASRVYMEVHGNGATSPSGKDAWLISNGASGSNKIIWYGTVWAPNGGISVGSGSNPPKVEGALWSGTNVTLGSGVSVTHVPLIVCPSPVADAGPDKTIVCPATQASIGTANSSGSQFSWTTLINGTETVVGTQQTITVNNPGTYTLTSQSSCGSTATDVVIVSYKSCVDPITINNGGKVNNLIGSELTYLTTNLQEAKKYLVILGNDDSVLIEAVAVVGKEASAISFLVGLGLTDIIPNGNAYQVISGKFPIANLININSRPDIINHCRPVFAPVGNGGVTTSEGDKSISADLARNGFNVGGEGIKIGVISDSYNTLPNNPALQDINNGDLPGTGNPDGNVINVDVVLEYPYGRRTDEGRAMMQIIHDLAPKAPLAFRTGFISAGDFASGIIELENAGCKVIVDDVTYITEPFFQDGVVSRAVNAVNNRGVAYLTSAGNFGARSYTSTFTRAPSPGAFAQSAHDFGGGDIYQKLKLKSGTYTIVLQWQDNIYSLAQTTGTQNDLDIYLVDQSGRIGFNRNNINGDPFEVLSFSINLADTSQVIEADLLITKADNSPDNPLFKYIIFRGNAIIDEYYSGQPLQNKSTIIGHANAEGSIAVGAVLFSNTPRFGNTPSVASFSSVGGTQVFVNGVPEVRAKPELTAPNGVNTSTTVVMGPDNDGLGNADGFPNFFGTSAAAPHAAAVAALVLEARKKFYNNELLTTSALKYFLFNSALSMQPDGVVNGVNYKAGYGLVQPDAAIRSFANPTPKINQLVYNAAITPGTAPFVVTVKGDYLTEQSAIYFRGTPLPTTYINANELQAEIPAFPPGNPAINVNTPSFPGATGDGGLSNSLYFFSVKKDTVTIIADNKQKVYGQALPELTTTILVNGDSLHVFNQKTGRNLTRASLGVDSLTIRYTTANMSSLSNAGIYQIRASRTFEPDNAEDLGLQELYHYDSTFGNLRISRLAVTVAPRDTTIVYGEPLDNFKYNYVFDPAVPVEDPTALTNIIKTSHEQYVDNSVLGVINNNGGGAVVVFNGQLLPVIENASVVLNGKLLPVVNGISGGAVVVFNGQEYPVTNGAGGAVVVFNGEELPVINRSGGAVVVFNGEILPVINRTAGGGAVVVFNGQEYPVTNLASGGAVVVFNGGQEVPVLNGAGGAVVVFNGQYYPVINRTAGGGAVVVFNGAEVPVSYGAGGAVVVFNGTEVPVLNGGTGSAIFANGQMLPVIPNVTGGGAVVVFNGAQVQTPYINGLGGSAVVVFNGKLLPVVNTSGGAVVVFNGQEVPVVNRASGGAVVVFNGEELPLVNSLSPATLTNMSTMASLNAIANARIVNGQTNKVIDVSANSFVTFNTSPQSAGMINALPFVNARSIVEANAIASGGAVTVFNRTGGAVTVFNGSGAYVNSTTLSSSINRTPVVVDQADLNSASGNEATIQMEGINMITGITCGEQTLIPATLFDANFDISYGNAKVNIIKAPLTITANNISKEYGDVLTLDQTAFTITSGNLKFRDKLAFATITSTGAGAEADPGTYDINISNAFGSISSDLNNYNITYNKGTLTVGASCPVIVHSRDNNFVNTIKSPVSLWLNIYIKVRGQLTKAGDQITFKGGRLTLENISAQSSVTNLVVPTGTIIADASITQPVTTYNPATQSFTTRVPLGYNSTADVFISGAIINSGTGFTKNKGEGSVLRGVFQSNVTYNGQWSYGMAAYTASTGPQYVQYTDLVPAGSVAAVSGSYKAGTPIPWISRITAGGTGNGGTNYTGSPTSNDNFSACVRTASVITKNMIETTSVITENQAEALKDIQVFPNPANSFVTLSFVASANGPSTLDIISINGNKTNTVYNGITEAGHVYSRRINIQGWPAGVYIVQLVENNKVTTKKLLISR